MVAFLTGHVVAAHLAMPSRDGRIERPTLALVTARDAVTVGQRPVPSQGLAIAWGDQGGDRRDSVAGFSAIGRIARELGVLSGAVGVELGSVPAAGVAALLEGVPSLEVRPLDGTLATAKAAKNEDEAAGVRAALHLCDVGQCAIRARVEPGVSELDLYGEAVRAMNRAAEGLVAPIGEIQVGRRGELIAGAPTSARIAVGELAMCDLAPRHPNGWWGDSCSTVACGSPSAPARRDWRALMSGLQAGAEALRPGARAADVYELVARYAGPQPGHVGHGIGRDHYEEPIIAPTRDELLQDGSVIVLEPGRYGDGRGIRIEHAFRVSADGGQLLSSFPLDL
jgi:Xaa-Pro aminopeptidase